MDTIKRQMRDALMAGDTLDELVCVYQPMIGSRQTYAHESCYDPADQPDPIRCGFSDLPERAFDAGYGGVQGEPTLCYSARYVYFRAAYDGAEGFDAVPRNPEYVTKPIPISGGG